jgi:hypothetical protein
MAISFVATALPPQFNSGPVRGQCLASPGKKFRSPTNGHADRFRKAKFEDWAHLAQQIFVD